MIPANRACNYQINQTTATPAVRAFSFMTHFTVHYKVHRSSSQRKTRRLMACAGAAASCTIRQLSWSVGRPLAWLTNERAGDRPTNPSPFPLPSTTRLLHVCSRPLVASASLLTIGRLWPQATCTDTCFVSLHARFILIRLQWADTFCCEWELLVNRS